MRPKCPNQRFGRLTALPPHRNIRAAVAGDQDGEVNLGRDGDGARPLAIAAAVPETAAYITGSFPFGPTGSGDQPSRRVSSGGCGRVQFCERIQPEQIRLAIGIGGISAQMNRDKFRPIRHRHVGEAGRGVEHWQFGSRAARVMRFAGDQGMAPGLVYLARGARRPKPAGGDAEWQKQTVAHEIFPRAPGDVFEHRPRDGIADIRISEPGEFGARSAVWGAQESIPRNFQTLVRRVFQGTQTRSQRSIGEEAHARAVGQELRQCDLFPSGVNIFDGVGKNSAQRVGPTQPAFLDEYRDECRGHRLAAGTEVKLVVECDSIRNPFPSDSGNTLAHDAVAPHNDSGDAERFGPAAEDWLQYWIKISHHVVLEREKYRLATESQYQRFVPDVPISPSS
jgi:hypothetical protein